jgi:DNA (cytosine-5)-methyltransferase 1
MSLTIGSLFSGIGGLELGLEWAGLGPVRWQSEIDPFCRGQLKKHWPEVNLYGDVRELGAATLAPVDIICGGFPCQDVSSAGKRSGLAGARSGLWREFARIVGEMLPPWVVIENVRSGAAKWVDQVRSDLERLGYESLPIPLAASDVGACHRRARVFIVATHGHGHGHGLRLEHWRRGWQERQKALEPARLASNLDAQGELQPSGGFFEERGWPSHAPRIWAAEPDVARMVHGLPDRLDREAALGNSVMPQCAEVVGWVIRELMTARTARARGAA